MDDKPQFNLWTIGAAIIIIVIAALILLIWSKPADHQTNTISNSGGATLKAVDQEQLAADYKTAADQIFADYFSAADAKPNELATLSVAAQNKLLALTLPAQYKDRHLQSVILLGEIAAAAQGGDASAAQTKLAGLKNLINQPR